MHGLDRSTCRQVLVLCLPSTVNVYSLFDCIQQVGKEVGPCRPPLKHGADRSQFRQSGDGASLATRLFIYGNPRLGGTLRGWLSGAYWGKGWTGTDPGWGRGLADTIRGWFSETGWREAGPGQTLAGAAGWPAHSGTDSRGRLGRRTGCVVALRHAVTLTFKFLTPAWISSRSCTTSWKVWEVEPPQTDRCGTCAGQGRECCRLVGRLVEAERGSRTRTGRHSSKFGGPENHTGGAVQYEVLRVCGSLDLAEQGGWGRRGVVVSPTIATQWDDSGVHISSPGSGRKDDPPSSTCSAVPTYISSSDTRTDSSGRSRRTGQAQGCTGPCRSSPDRGGRSSWARSLQQGFQP
ncbi:hypothetical protein E2C01_023211 [Portunus trituberculatus]|uniref:Uncharacterized protein n=1 Tax=Portunus trituberculatus TaxID=210409 RepID=A0A5B7E9C9_PORTR|nr:hypothetical protein [Portunus trituberculatus]